MQGPSVQAVNIGSLTHELPASRRLRSLTPDVTTERKYVSTLLTEEAIDTLDQLAEAIQAQQPLVAFTGAGISTESGIPDYRGKQGLWTTGNQQPFTYQEFMENPDAQRRWWQELPKRFYAERDVEPNEGHHALVRLERAGILKSTITQNIDGLHQVAGANPEHVVELHGNTRSVRCTNCGTVWPTGEFLALVGGTDDPPPCPVCGGVVKNGTIAFGQPLPQAELRRAFDEAGQAGVMLVVGSTLLVNPAAQIPAHAKANGAVLAIINMGETPLDPYADFRLDASAGASLSYLAGAVLEGSDD